MISTNPFDYAEKTVTDMCLLSVEFPNPEYNETTDYGSIAIHRGNIKFGDIDEGQMSVDHDEIWTVAVKESAAWVNSSGEPFNRSGAGYAPIRRSMCEEIRCSDGTSFLIPKSPLNTTGGGCWIENRASSRASLLVPNTYETVKGALFFLLPKIGVPLDNLDIVSEHIILTIGQPQNRSGE